MSEENNIKWTFSIFNENQRYLTFIKKIIRHEFRKNWFTRVTTPILEKRSVYDNLIWNNDSFDEKVFSINNKVDNEEIILRPNNSLGLFNLYINEFLEKPQPVSMYYLNEQFRNIEKADDCNFREFFQVGCEVIGEDDPILDAQIISIWQHILDSLWLKWKYEIKINSMWLDKEIAKFKEDLISYLNFRETYLSEDDKKTLENNPLDIFKTDNEDVIELLSQAPKISEFRKKKSNDYYAKLKENLDMFEVDYIEDESLIQSSEIYEENIFKFIHKDSKETLISGWRKNSVIWKMWYKKEVPALWWSMTIQRVIDILKKENIKLKDKDQIDLFLVQLWEDARKLILPISKKAREKWLNVMVSLWTPSIKVQNKRAVDMNAKFVAIVWIMEARKWTCQLKDLAAWTQKEIKLDELVDTIVDNIWENSLTFYSPLRDLVIWE